MTKNTQQTTGSILKIKNNPDRAEWSKISQRKLENFATLEKTVEEIFSKVQTEGDDALLYYTYAFDGVGLASLTVPSDDFSEAERAVSPDLQRAIKEAAENIAVFHETQKEEIRKVGIKTGVNCWRKSVPIEKVGLYIPGGTAPLFSTVLMLGIPAKIAGCKEIVLCTPPDSFGKIHPAILYAASVVGIRKIFKVGGAQAIAAMGFGTQTVPKTDKIFGPGNQYVTAAKMLLNKRGVAIDLPAGPSELLIIADETANPKFLAADLLSQAEHGKDSQVILVCTNDNIAKNTVKEIEKQIEKLPRKDIAAEALKNSHCLVFSKVIDAIDFSNFYAPEHLIIASDNAEEYAELIENAGSVFLGHYAPESAGDYASGTNHTLPTNAYARAYSGVSLDSYVKKITFQHLTYDGLKSLASTIETMAAAENLEAHRKAVAMRFDRE
jgi:histidinol dehydrogenase